MARYRGHDAEYGPSARGERWIRAGRRDPRGERSGYRDPFRRHADGAELREFRPGERGRFR